ncbi:MAG: hypothetical protein AAB400_01510 [Patescibacteria group bacterium]
MHRLFFFIGFMSALFLFSIQEADAARFCNGSSEPKTEVQCYDEEGFFSGSAVIEQGTKILFRNDSKENLNVASGSHPTHDLLSDLDSGMILPGQSWSYTFKKRGSWEYHNHLRPDHESDVLVVKKKEQDIFRTKVPQLQSGPLPKALSERMPKLPKPSKKYGIKKVVAAGKAEVVLRTRRLDDAMKSARYLGLENLIQPLTADLEKVRAIGNRIEQAKERSAIELAVRELIALGILSKRIPVFELQKASTQLKSTLETYEDLALQLEPSLKWQDGDEEKQDLQDALADIKETITNLDDDIDEFPSVPPGSIRGVYERIVKDIKNTGKTLQSLIQSTKNLNSKQNTSKGFDDLTSGRACEQSRASSYQTLDVICYKDEAHDFWNYGKVGKKVYFYNASSHDLWIAADPHPTHTSVPEFNSLKSIAPGSYFEYTFTKPGKYYYHNHLKPERTMKLKISTSDTIEIEAEDMEKMQPQFMAPNMKLTP